MRNYLTDMKHVMGFTAILAVLLFGMTFVVAGNAAVVPGDNNVALGAAAAVPPAVLGANRSALNPATNNPFFVRPALNPAINNPFFVRPAFNPFFVGPAFNPFFRPFFNPFIDVDVAPFGAFGAAVD